jgi:fructose-1,6-bisphosphatase/inositol monophosphatase family enzyme
MAVYDRDDFKVFTKEGNKVDSEEAKTEISTKYKTEADDASHKAIAQVMGEREYKNIPLIFEEADWKQTTQRTYISFDEMDGTGRFIKRKPGFMVLSQYVEDGIPFISVNYDPKNDRLFYAIKGEGSFINNSQVNFSQAKDIQNARIIVNGRDKERTENANYWKFMHNQFGERLSAGLATGSRMAAILEDKYDVFVNNGSEQLHMWDLGMVLNIIEAGGVVTRKDGSPIGFQKPGVIDDIICSANPKLHEQIVRVVSQYK